MIEEERKTLRDYLMDGNVRDRVFFDRHENESYRVLNIRIGRASGFDFAYLHLHYLGKKYDEGEDNICSFCLGMDDLEVIAENSEAA